MDPIRTSYQELRNRAFKKFIHISSDGDVLISKSRNRSYNIIDNAEEVNHRWVRLKDIPPALKAIEINIGGKIGLLIITQNYEVLLINRDYPQGIILGL